MFILEVYALNEDVVANEDVWFVKTTLLPFNDKLPVTITEPVNTWVLVKSLPNLLDPLE